MTDIIKKCDSYFITNCDKSLLQNVSGFLLQNATVFLENATVITKCDLYYKMRRYRILTTAVATTIIALSKATRNK